MTHTINKLQFEAVCCTEAEAFELRSAFVQNQQKEIVEVIDKVCSQYVAEDEWVHIDRLEFDFSDFDLLSFEQQFAKLFKEKFEKTLVNKIGSISMKEKESSKEIFYHKLLFYYLQTGVMPWWGSDVTLDMNSILQDLMRHQSATLKKFLIHHQNKEKIWQRIAFQFNPEMHNQIIIQLTKLQKALMSVKHWLNSIDEACSLQKVNFILPSEEIQYRFVLENAVRIFDNSFYQTNSVAFRENFMEKLLTLFNSQSAIAIGNEILEASISNELKEDSLDIEKVDEISSTTLQENAWQEEQELSERYMIQNAGIVLIVPFLPQLFTKLTMLEHKEWKSRDMQFRAVHLLHYIASGETSCPEFNAVFEKLICGLSLDTPIPLAVELSEQELFEVNELLQSVILHWDKLKNTSIDGLRETFFKRDGILYKKEKDWFLQIERKTVDVLLESLPWAFSNLALSWNNYLICTEW